MGLRIGVGSEWIGEKVGGLERYATSLIRSLLRVDRRNSYDLFVTPRGATQLEDLADDRIRIRSTALNSRWHYVPLGLPLGLARHPVDVFHATFTVVPWCPAKRIVLTIHDVCPDVHPDFFPPAVRMRLRWLLARGAARATRILVPSAATKRELTEYYDVDESKISVIHEGVHPYFLEDASGADEDDDKRDQDPTDPSPQDFALYVGRFHSRKNLERLIDAFSILRKRRRGPRHLVLAGRELWHGDPVANRIRELGLQDDVICPGHVSDRELARLYRRARVFVYPSLHEGFGLPPLEAMARGLPVLASNRSAMPEVLADAAMLVDPFEAEAIADGLDRLTHDSTLRDGYIERGRQRVQRFSWESAARKTLELYEETFRQAS